MKPSLKQAALLTTSLLVFCCASANAQEWTAGAGGTGHWEDGSNWAGDVAPLNANDVALFINTTASVTLPATSTSIGAIDIGDTSNVQITGTTTTFTVQDFYVYDNSTATLSLPTGSQFTVTNTDSFIGDGAFGTGSLTVTGSGVLSYTAGGTPLFVGGGGIGTMTQTGSSVDITGTLTVGSDNDNFFTNAPGSGLYNLSGTSTLTVDGLYLGASGSSTIAGTTGSFTMTGGTVVANDLIVLGVATYSPTGTVNGTTGVFNQMAGSVSTDVLEVGQSGGGIGSYTLGSGTFSSTLVIIGDQAGASGTFTQSGGTGTATILAVGETGTGTYALSSGTMTVLTGGNVLVGDQSGSKGTVTQTGGALVIQGTSDLTVGNDGSGSFSQQAGSVTVGGALDVGTGAGTGTYSLSSGTLNVTGPVAIGNGTTASAFNYNGGTLTYAGGLTVASGSSFNQGTSFDLSTSAGNPVTLLSGAIYNLNAGTLKIGGDMTTPGFSGISATAGAIFNFNGGTVAPTGSDWFDSLNGAVTGDSTIDTTANNAVLTGDLSGSGLLTITGGHEVDLDLTGGTSTAGAFSVDVVNGTFGATAATFPSVGDLTIESAGIVNMGAAGTHTLSGNVSGAGAFNVTFTGGTDLLELTGDTDLTGTTTLGGGGTLEVADGSLGRITGAGAMIIGGPASSGMVTFTNANNNYTGTTTINSGYTLIGNSILGTGLVTNNGTIGTNASTFHIGGNFVSNGTILINMHSLPGADVYAVAGTANVTGSSFTILNPAVATGTFTFLTSTGLTANNLVQPSSNLFTHATVQVDTTNTNDLDLVTSTTTSSGIAGLSLTPNQQAVANTLDALILNPSSLPPAEQANLSTLLNAIGHSGTTPAQLAQNYEELTPQSLQYAQAIAYEHSAFLVNKVDGFDDALHHEFSGFDTNGVSIVLPGFNSDLGREMQSMLAYDPAGFHDAAPNGVNYYPGEDSTPPPASSPEPGQIMSDSPTTAPMPVRTEPHSVTLRKPDSNFSAFIGGDGTVADLNQNGGASYAPSSKASYSSVDAIAGVSYRMTSNLAAGILFDYDHTDATTDTYGSKTKVDSYSPGVFATYGDKGFYVNGLFAYGRNDYSNERAVPVVNGIANSSPGGNQYTGALDAGYDFHLGQGWTVTPAGGLTYTHLDIDGFTENGAAPADLTVDAQHDDSLRSRLGGYVTYLTSIGQITLLPSFSAMWQHEFMDENAPITSQFNDFSSGAFTIHSVSMGRDSALISVGLTAELTNSMAIFFNASADVNNDYNAENFIGGFKGSF